MTIDEFIGAVRAFNTERGWIKRPAEFFTALITEVGELAECYQWKEKDFAPNTEEKALIASEMADVVIYIACMAIAENIDLSQAIVSKLEHNAKKYPVGEDACDEL